MDDERAAFLAAIQADWDNDELRLVYADWLEEHGEHDEARRQRDWPAVREASKERVREIAEDLGDYHGYRGHQPMNYDVLMQAAHDYLEHGDCLIQEGGQSWQDEFPAFSDEFWEHYEIITGRTNADERDSFFRCSC